MIESSAKMSPGSSKLNPYAVAYVPLAKRGEVANLAPSYSDSSVGNVGIGFHNSTVPFYGSSSQEYGQDAENQADIERQIELDMSYLQTKFPTVSEQSLFDVYSVNEYDLDAAYDMLSQLEVYVL